MNSPVHPGVPMQDREIEPGFKVYECPRSGGYWIPLQAYLDWKDRQPPDAAKPSGILPAGLLDDSDQPARICPESGRVLLRYRVGHGLPFQIDSSPATGGIWLDKGEWEAIKCVGLQLSLHRIATSAYQREVRATGHAERMVNSFRDKIGECEFQKVREFEAWLTGHPGRRDICCYLLGSLLKGSEVKVPPE